MFTEVFCSPVGDSERHLAPVANGACHTCCATIVSEDEVHGLLLAPRHAVEAIWVLGVEGSDPGAFLCQPRFVVIVAGDGKKRKVLEATLQSKMLVQKSVRAVKSNVSEVL